MATWPAYGRLLLDGYAEQPQPAVRRSEMENGSAKQAQHLSQTYLRRPVSYTYTAAEFASWKTWFRDTIARGADWFDWEDPADGATKLARILGGEYTAAAEIETDGAPLSWQVSITMETLE